MKPIIGIIMRKSISEMGHKIKYIYQDIFNCIIKSGGIPIGISNDDISLYLNICNGFILQGGDEIEENDLEIIKTLYEKDIPLLGICLGMQEMAYYFNGKEINIDNHFNNNLHEVVINEDSLLYKIINTSKILVNSRHKYTIYNTTLKKCAYSSDNTLEAVEDTNKLFFLGLQWHPENMYIYDLNSRKIFDYFIKVCNDMK